MEERIRHRIYVTGRGCKQAGGRGGSVGKHFDHESYEGKQRKNQRRGQRLQLRLSRCQGLHAVWAGRRQAQDENCSALGLVVTCDLAAMVLHDSVDGAEAEAGAFTDGLGRVKGVKDAVRFFDAGAAVAELDDDVIALLSGGDLKQASPALFEGIDGVFENLDEGLEELVAIPPNLRQAGLDRSLDTDVVFVRLNFVHLHAALQKHANVNHSFFFGALLGKAQ